MNSINQIVMASQNNFLAELMTDSNKTEEQN